MTVTIGQQPLVELAENERPGGPGVQVPLVGALIQNPVLTGFHPEPSILRVGDDYYLATSTFEWAPGVALHHSRDLAHWRPIGGALEAAGLIDLLGVPDSGGVWAPDLSYARGLFHLVFSNVRNRSGAFRDAPSYVVTASSIEGPWSAPLPLPSRGFDPSLFHDEDGRDWLLSVYWDHRPGRDPFSGIVAQEFDPVLGRAIGASTLVFGGTELGVVEGPHLYQRDGWYYLVTAEGGTSYEHAVTVARSRSLLGPYEVHPTNPVVSSFDRLDLPLQKVGHASLVEAVDGTWWMAALCARPLTPLGRCVLGRETAILRVDWTDEGWPYVVGGVARQQVSGLGVQPHPWPEAPACDDFDRLELGPEWMGLRRTPTADWADLASRPGWLRITGGESLGSTFRQALVARRQQHHACVAETVVEFAPDSFQQLAGLVHYYQTGLWHYLRVSCDDEGRRILGVLSCDHGRLEQPVADMSIEGWDRVHLRAEVRGADLTFSYGADGHRWSALGPVLDASRLSDEYATVWRGLEAVSEGFTGAVLGLCVQDLSGTGATADFDSFTYRPMA